MPVHEQCRTILAAAAAADATVFDTEDPQEARRLYRASIDAFAPPTPALRAVADRTLPGCAAPVRVYTPHAADGGEGLPILVFLHGGGWVFGDLDTHDAVCRCLAHAAGCLVLSVDYRLAPEHKFPTALEDSLAVIDWAAAQGRKLGGDPTRIAIGGDSAGGNLAAAATLALRDAGGPKLALQLLVYPATDFTADTPSKRANGDGFLLTNTAIDWMRDCYLNDPAEARDPRASPGLATDFSGLPPALVMTAEYDPLRDEGRSYARALAAAGVPVRHIDYPGMIHGFLRMGALVDCAGKALGDAARVLRAAFRQP